MAIERHASKIYTSTMFEEFGHLLIEGTTYNLTEVVKLRKYLTTHHTTAKREKWCRVVYEVSVVSEDQPKFTCECGKFEHRGMLCCHVLRVSSLDIIILYLKILSRNVSYSENCMQTRRELLCFVIIR